MTDTPANNQERQARSGDNSFSASIAGTGEAASGEEKIKPVVLEPGSVVLDKYKIVELVGLGGMGSVFRVTHVHLGSVFALKCLNKEQPKDHTWRRFQNEAKAAHILDHPNLIKVHDFGLLPGRRPYFVMDYVDGTTVADEVQRLGRLPVRRCLRIFIQVAFAIAHAHEQGVIHRDLKSSNIMVVKQVSDEEELVKIVDFGIAKLTGADEYNQQTLTKTGEIFGSPLFMSPEQCSGLSVDNRSDLYSLGCMLYEALTGAPPFIGESALATMMMHQNEPPLSLKQASMGIDFPVELEKIVAKLLEKDPNKRYQNASSLAADLISLENSMKADTAASGTLGENARSGSSLYKQKEASIFAGNPVGQFLIGAIAFFAGVAVCYLAMQNELEAERARKRPIVVEAQPKISAPALDEKPFSHIDEQSKERVFEFPKVKIGALLFADGTAVNCVDVKRVPESRLIGFNPTYDALSKNPDLVKKFAPDDLILLYLSRNDMAQTRVFRSIPHLTGLKAINLKFTDFSDSDVQYVEVLPNLSYLNVSFTTVTGDALARMKNLKNLTALHAGGLANIAPLLERVSEMPRLAQLTVHGDSLDDESLLPISRSKTIQALSIGTNRNITDAGMKHIAKMKQLKYLDLYGTSVTPKAISILKQLPNLQTLIVSESMGSREHFSGVKKELKTVKFPNGSPASHAPKYALDFQWNGEGL